MIDLTKIEDINLRSELLKQNLIQQLQEAKLPIVIIKYIMNELAEQINTQFITHCSQVGFESSSQETVEEIPLGQNKQD